MAKLIESRRQFKSKLDSKQDVSRAIPALMGDGKGAVEVPGQPGYVYIRVGDGDLGQAFNNRCPLRDNLAIHVGYDPVIDPDRRIFQVLSTRMIDYSEGGSTPIVNVPPHHTYHEYGGGDDVFVDWRRLMGLRVGRPSAFQVTVDEGVILRAGAWLEVAAQTLNLAASQPAGASSRYVLITLDATGVATATAGAIVAGALNISDCPVPGAGEIPLAAVRLYGTQTAIGDTPTSDDIVDLRFPQANTAGQVFLADLSGYARGSIIRGGAVDWESYALGGITGSVLTRNATDVIWSGYALSGTAGGTTNFAVTNTKTLTFTATDSYNLTIPATGTAVLGTGANTRLGIWSGVNTLSSDANLTWDSVAPAVIIGSAVVAGSAGYSISVAGYPYFMAKSTTNTRRSAIVLVTDSGYADSHTVFTQFNSAVADAIDGVNMSKYGAFGSEGTAGAGLYFYTSIASAPIYFAINGTRKLSLTGTGMGVGAVTAPGYLIDAGLSDATTNVVTDMIRLRHTTSGVPTTGFGTGITFGLKSSTTGNQNAATEEVFWTDATHASRTALRRGTTTGNAVNTGYYGFWNYSAVANVAITIIPNATGDVTEVLTAVYVVSAVTGGDANGGTCTLEPSDSFNLYSDGTDTCTLAVAADGSVTIQRTAGADTFKVSLWMVWQ